MHVSQRPFATLIAAALTAIASPSLAGGLGGGGGAGAGGAGGPSIGIVMGSGSAPSLVGVIYLTGSAGPAGAGGIAGNGGPAGNSGLAGIVANTLTL